MAKVKIVSLLKNDIMTITGGKLPKQGTTDVDAWESKLLCDIYGDKIQTIEDDTPKTTKKKKK